VRVTDAGAVTAHRHLKPIPLSTLLCAVGGRLRPVLSRVLRH